MMKQALKLTGGGILAFGLLSPLAYCEAQSIKAKAENERLVILACIEAGGNWSHGISKSCELPQEQPNDPDT